MMERFVTKRNGDTVAFNKEKVYNAVSKANNETDELTFFQIGEIVTKVEQTLASKAWVDVEEIQDVVEDTLMASGFTKTAKAYIIYRDERAKDRKRDIFKPRKNLKPYEYPELEEYVTAIRSSYWIHTEYNYTSDIQNFHVQAKPHERNAIKNAMLAISQVEVDVKTFWGDLYRNIQKPELANVGYTFADSEVRHSDAYSHLLDLLGLSDAFEKYEDIPALNDRVEYLKSHIKYANAGTNKDYVVALTIFSAIIENASLFSQFLIIMSFNKYKNMFSGISNVIEATSKEEQLHFDFGVDLVNIIKEEHSEYFEGGLIELIKETYRKAYKSELSVIDWIFEDGELDFMPKQTVLEFLKNRMNNSMEAIGIDGIFEVDEDTLKETEWFDIEVLATKHVDFFYKRSVNYTKRSQGYTEDDLF